MRHGKWLAVAGVVLAMSTIARAQPDAPGTSTGAEPQDATRSLTGTWVMLLEGQRSRAGTSRTIRSKARSSCPAAR